MYFVRLVFLACVAVESLLSGLWLLLWPEELFRLLEKEPRDLILWRGLGVLLSAHVPCLALAAWRRRDWRYVVIVPIVGRALLAGLWIWLLLSDRVTVPQPMIRILLIEALIWLPGLALTLRPDSDEWETR